MKNQIITVTFLVTMFMTSCESKISKNKTEVSTTEQTQDVKYQCPMKCEGDKTYEKPGQCPVCNMDLVKVKESHELHDHDTIEHHNH